jgi:hypothetical protein
MTRCFVVVFFATLLAVPAQAIDREAFTVIHYQLEAQIDRASHVMAVTGRISLRNDSTAPQKNVALQISSSLAWNGIAFKGEPVEFIDNPYTSDIDHTGALSEAIVTLPTAVAPGGKVDLDIQYGGTVTADSTRFTRMGAPAEIARRSDWDQIGESFTAVRGLGDVVWYPVSLPAVSMSEGSTVFAAIAAWKARHKDSQFDAHIQVISGDVKLCIAGSAMAAPCGEFSDTSDPRSAGITSQVSNDIHLTGLGGMSPAFAVSDYARLERPSITVFHVPSNASIAKDYAAAAEANAPVLDEWLPPRADAITVVELTDPNANPYQDGPLLFTPMRQSDTAALGLLLMPTQVAARFPSSRQWIENGLQRFLQAVSVEKRIGRKDALQFLNEYLPPLVQAEEPADLPASTEKSATSNLPGNSLVNTSDEILLRGKGSFVFWMLRDMLGDSVLQKALAAYRPPDDTSPAYFQGLLEEGHKRDLEWFFDDWVYRDRGLPDFRIESVYARPLLNDPNKMTLVTVTIENRGGATAEVPVILQTPQGERTIRVRALAHQKSSGRLQLPGMPTHAFVNDGSVPALKSGENTYDVPAPPTQPEQPTQPDPQ